MRLLIIGCGYVGSRCAAKWLEAGHSVTALTRSTERAAEWEQQGIHAVVGDVLEPNSLAAFSEYDACLYAVGFDRTAGTDKRAVYVTGLENVLRAIRQRCPRLIYISSTSVYGEDHGEWVTEDTPAQPVSESGRICLDAEQLIEGFYPTSADTVQADILRLAGIYGPGRLIGRREQLLQQIPLKVNPQGWLNLIHVDDAVACIAKLLEQPTESRVHLLTDGTPHRREEFYRTFAELAGTPAPRFEGGHESLGKRCDSTRMREELGLRLMFPEIRLGLEHALAAASE